MTAADRHPPRKALTMAGIKNKNENENRSEEHDFTLLVGGVSTLTDEVENRLFEAGCDDATLAFRRGLLCLDFSRTAPSLQDAVLSAVRAVRSADIGGEIFRIDSCNLVSASEIARKIGRSRQLVHQYASGERGPGGFPPPECHLKEDRPLWAWCAVSSWLAEHQFVRPEVSLHAEVLEAINRTLATDRQARRLPNLVREIAEGLRIPGEPASCCGG